VLETPKTWIETENMSFWASALAQLEAFHKRDSKESIPDIADLFALYSSISLYYMVSIYLYISISFSLEVPQSGFTT
jgi:hypothetical protein